METRYYVYQLRLEGAESPFYIGKGKGRRSKSHFTNSSLSANSHKNNVILKAMRDGIAVLVEIIHQNLSESRALEIEESLIASYGRRNFGGCLTDVTTGGEGMSGYTASEETKRKMSASAKNVVKTEEWKSRIGASMVGKRHSEETKERLRVLATGRRHSEESKKKMAAASAGRVHSEETKKKIASKATSRLRDASTRAAISESLKSHKRTDEHNRNLIYARWDKNAAYMDADKLYHAWLNNGRPGGGLMESIHPGLKLFAIVRRFAKGWIPAEDSEWLEYRASRPVRQAD